MKEDLDKKLAVIPAFDEACERIVKLEAQIDQALALVHRPTLETQSLDSPRKLMDCVIGEVPKLV